jgi:hypothetical protein
VYSVGTRKEVSMDPVSLVVVPGFLGGLLIALVVFARNRRGKDAPPTRA